MSYLNSVTIVGFVGADPEQRQARNNVSKFTVLSVATQRSWKNAEDEWVSKVEWHRIVIIWNQDWRQFRRASNEACLRDRLRWMTGHAVVAGAGSRDASLAELAL
jgi:Single-strand binding protein family